MRFLLSYVIPHNAFHSCKLTNYTTFFQLYNFTNHISSNCQCIICYRALCECTMFMSIHRRGSACVNAYIYNTSMCMHACVCFCTCVCMVHMTYTLNEWSRNGNQCTWCNYRIIKYLTLTCYMTPCQLWREHEVNLHSVSNYVS